MNKRRFYGGVAQRLEHSAHTRGVAGSIPATATIWRVGEAAELTSLSRWHSGVRIPYASPKCSYNGILLFQQGAWICIPPQILF